MALGLGVLGVAPAVLWSMTLREFEAALDGRLGAIGRERPMTGRQLHDLINRYPDASSAGAGEAPAR